MTAKEELKQLILSLNTEDLEKAVFIFQGHFLEKREARPLRSPKAPLPNQLKPA